MSWWHKVRAWAAVFGAARRRRTATFAALAALAAAKTKEQPVRVRVNRDLDMMITGKAASVPRRASRSGTMLKEKLLAAKN